MKNYKKGEMKNFSVMTIFTILIQLMLFNSVTSQQVTLSIQESDGLCELATNCVAGIICFDIGMTVDIDKELDSYNIWVKYNQDIMSRVNGGSDASCVIADGGDTNAELAAGAYRVAGVPGNAYPMTGGIEELVHTICFNILDESALYGSTVSVGGSLFGALPTTVTFSEGSDEVPEENLLVMSQTTVSCLSALPIELLSFEAEKSGTSVDLKWETGSEYNNAHFDVQRARDGASFSSIGIVYSKGNHADHESYQLTDLHPIVGHNYYRLMQVDRDGEFTYSEIKVVDFFGSAKQFALYQNMPNPFINQTMIGFELPEAMEVTVLIFDHVGKEVYRVKRNFSAGYQTIELDRKNLLAPGVLYYQLQAGEFIASKKMILIE